MQRLAIMTSPRTFVWSTAAVLGLLVSTAALAVVGVCAMFLHLPADWASAVRTICVIAFASVAGFALAVAQAATALLSTFKSRPDRKAGFVAALACAILCGLVSLAGAHLGYALLTGRIEELPPTWVVDLGGLGLAFVKPAMSFAIAECVAIDKADHAAAGLRADADRAAAEADARGHRHAENLARIGAQTPPISSQQAPSERAEQTGRSPANARRKDLTLVQKATLAAVGGLALMGAGEHAQAQPISSQLEPATNAQAAPAITAEARAEARSLIAQGLKVADVHARTGVPLGTLRRQAAEFKARPWAA